MPTWVIKDHMDEAARECSITPPSNWLTSAEVTHLQFRSILKDVVRDMLARHDWAPVTTDTTFTGAGASFSLPNDFLRVIADDNAVYETSPTRRRVLPMANRGDWTETKKWNFTGVQRYFRLQSTTIEFLSALPAGGSVDMAYVQKTWIITNASARASVWGAIDDNSLLPGWLLQLGVVWRWRRHKGLIYADRRAEFESEFARACGDDGPRRVVDFTGPSAGALGPMRAPVPDFIPPA